MHGQHRESMILKSLRSLFWQVRILLSYIRFLNIVLIQVLVAVSYRQYIHD